VEDRAMTASTDVLAPALLEQVLEKLGLDRRPEATLEGLTAVYDAWCRRVPFDNVRKLIHLAAGATTPFPGGDAEEFFTSWLAHGTGGTCWSGNGGLHALVSSLGFSATRGIGTMLSSPGTPPNHGTVTVLLEGERYMVDASILHGLPLRLDETEVTKTVHPAWGVRCEMREGHWHIRWRPFTAPDGFDCRIERLQASAVEFSQMYEATRPWGPFNYSISARLIRSDELVGAGLGRRVRIDASGSVEQGSMTLEERARLLIDQIGMSEEIVSQLPPDRELPPPPWAPSAPTS